MTLGRNSLKWIAAASMLCDHIACVFLQEGNAEQFAAWSFENRLYLFLRIIGRIAFPIFCFVLVQGFLTTRNIRKYLLRLLVFALLSEIPYDLALSNRIMDLSQQNVIFTLFIGVVVLYGIQRFFKRPWLQGGVILLGCLMAFYLQVDYSVFGIGCIVMFYLLAAYPKQWLWLMAVPFVMMENIEPFAVLALPICSLYDTEKEERRMPRYFFYLFYPAHLFILWAIFEICQKIC